MNGIYSLGGVMSNPFKILNLDALKKAKLCLEPFPYLIVDNIIHPEVLDAVVASFPHIDKRGSFPLNSINCKGNFELLMQELQRPELKEIIGQRFEMDLKENPTMITVRGYTTERDGNIHVDSISKLITLLLYLNPNWQSPKGKLRLLYNKNDLEPFAAEVAPEAGRCLIFKVTRNCWHGHEVFVGERKSIQLNYVTNEEDRERHLKRHRFSAFLKRLFSKKNEANPTY